MTGEGMNNSKIILKKKYEESYSKIPVFGSSPEGVVTLRQLNNQPQGPLNNTHEPIQEETEGPKYSYIGYEQDYSIDDSQSYCSVEMLRKMAMDAFRAKNYYLAMQYFNKILIKNPGNKEALFFKKKVLRQLQELKQGAI